MKPPIWTTVAATPPWATTNDVERQKPYRIPPIASLVADRLEVNAVSSCETGNPAAHPDGSRAKVCRDSDDQRVDAVLSSTQAALERKRQRADRPLHGASRGRLVGELLVITPPEPLATFLDQRRYLPKGVPLLKRVVALPGQTVCRTDRTIIIDGLAVGNALGRDHLGRPLPVWLGCRLIAAGQVFLMNRQSPDSFDGRYFGPLRTTAIVGRADPLWTHEKD